VPNPLRAGIRCSAAGGVEPGRFERHRPEETLLYKILQTHWRTFLAQLEDNGKGDALPRFIIAEIEAFLRCGILAHGFLRVRCEDCGEHRLVAFSCKRRGFCPSCIGRRMSDTAAHLVDQVLPRVPIRQWVLTVPHGLRYKMAFDPTLTGRVLHLFARAVSAWLRRRARRVGIAGVLKTGAVTMIQRFDSALGLNVHFHSLFLDGVYARERSGRIGFHPVPAPTDQDVASVVERLFRVVTKEIEAAHDDLAWDEPALALISQASVRRRVATGLRQGLSLRRLGGSRGPVERWITGRRCAQVEGFNLHANVRIAANDRAGLETICRYMGRPPLSADRLTEIGDGNLALRLKRPWSDGTTHLVFSPAELIERLIPLVPRPRGHLTRYHGVLAPASGWRRHVVPCNEVTDSRAKVPAADGSGEATRKMNSRGWTPWAALLKRVFLADALACPRCGGRMCILAAILTRASVQAILVHAGQATEAPLQNPSHWARAPSQALELSEDLFVDPPAPEDA
jgi:hypothetical protein